MQEPEAGYIYILQNESLAENRLKIGRTHHDPNFRAEDLSRSTGVPTPFSVIWSAFTDDCIAAEKIVHELLAEYRTNPRREFFDVDPDEAIIAANEAVARTLRWADWWDFTTRGRRTVGAFFFHSFVRPIARLPVVVLLLGFLILWKTIVAGFRILVCCLLLPTRIFRTRR